MFCPDENNFLRTVAAWRGLGDLNGNDGRLIITGWMNSRFLDDPLMDAKPWGAKMKLLDKNYGKSYAVNRIVEKYVHDDHYVMLLDGDIIVPCTATLSSLRELMSKRESLDAVAFGQRGDCRHHPHPGTSENMRGWKLTRREGNIGIAGGAVMVRGEIIRKYPLPELGAYGPDDVQWMDTLARNQVTCWLSLDEYVIHPFAADPAYEQWKQKMAIELHKKYGLDRQPNREEINDLCREADSFWGIHHSRMQYPSPPMPENEATAPGAAPPPPLPNCPFSP